MTSFETTNTVTVEIDDRSLTEARADVGDALSSVPLDVQAEVSDAAGGGEDSTTGEWEEQHSLKAADYVHNIGGGLYELVDDPRDAGDQAGDVDELKRHVRAAGEASSSRTSTRSADTSADRVR